MTIRTVLLFPDKQLRKKCATVVDVDDDVRALVEDLKDTCRAYRANGLAAPQIGELQRIFVMQIDNEEEPVVFINPEILERDDPGFKMQEGCLSFPGISETIERHQDVLVKALDATGEVFTLSLDKLEATAVQHEHDHLDGVLFIDYVSSLKRRRILKKLQKITKKPKVKKPVASPRAAARKERKRQRAARR